MGDSSATGKATSTSSPTSTAKKPTSRTIGAAGVTGGFWPGGRAAGRGFDCE